MKKIWNAWTGMSLMIRILIGLAIGVILGLTAPQAGGISILGNIFVGALKAIAPILVFVLIISSLCNAKQSHGKIIGNVIFLYIISTIIAAFVAVIASRLFPVAIALPETPGAVAEYAPAGITEVLENLLMNLIRNPVASLAEANYIGILFWSILIGIAMKKAPEGVKRGAESISNAISSIVKIIIEFAPIGILGLIYDSISTSGLDIFVDYGKLLLLLVGCMLFITFVTNPMIVFFCIRKNPYPLVLKCLKKSAVTAFFTRSSAANIPVNMEACEEFGLDRDTYSVTIPLGATINMDGAAITITVMTLATCVTLGISVDFPTAIVLSILATISACGASGVAGGSLLLIPMACSLFGIPDAISMQVVAVGFIIGVIQDSVETALNSSSDLLLSASAEFMEWRKEGKEIPF